MTRKISQFTGNSVIPSDSFLTFISGNQNYKISISDFLNAIGVTGDITQVGDDGVAVLNQPTANVNQIRNILAQKGVAASVTASGGLEINADFQKGAAGLPILINEDTQPLIRNLQAGQNVTIEDSGNELLISAGSAVLATNTVIVNSVNDFPDLVGSTYFLEDNTLYILSSSFSIGTNKIGLGNGTTITGSGLFAITLTADPATDGGGNPEEVIYSRGAYRNSIEDITVNAPGRRVFDITSTTKREGLFFCKNVFVEQCEWIGNFRDLGGVGFNNVVFDVVTGTQGFNFAIINSDVGAGDFQSVNLDSVFINEWQTAGTILKLNDSKFDVFSFENSVVAGTAYTLISGISAGANRNINTGGYGTIRANSILGTASTINITPSSPEWEFGENSGIQNSTNGFSIALVDNSTVTTINSVGVITTVKGTWIELSESRFIATSAGTAQYIGETDINLNFTATFSVTRAGSGGPNTVVFYLYKNGVQVPNVESRTDLETGAIGNVSLNTILPITNGDILTVRVANTTATNDLTIIDSQVLGVG